MHCVALRYLGPVSKETAAIRCSTATHCLFVAKAIEIIVEGQLCACGRPPMVNNVTDSQYQPHTYLSQTYLHMQVRCVNVYLSLLENSSFVVFCM